jgi:putative molybdopterin biosynthesis protein
MVEPVADQRVREDDPPRTAPASQRPGPQTAYRQWLAACAKAGWRAQPIGQQVPVSRGLGRVTAAPVRARWPSPNAACAAMDGIAISADAAAGAAGPWQLTAAAFTWVDTGDPLPPGTDTVVERERVQAHADGTATITGRVPRGLHVRAAGEDFQAGQLLIPAGHRLRPGDLAAAAAGGHTTLAVARVPVAEIIPTGDEIRPPGSVLQPGEAADTNSLMLATRAGLAGAVPVTATIQPDDPAVIAAEVRRAARTADLILVIAGSSAGRSDYTATVLSQVGGLAVRGVAVRPGHPVLLGHASHDLGPTAGPGGQARAVPVIGVPGYPLAAAVIFELFAVPLLAALQGAVPAEPSWQRAQLGSDWTSPPEVEEWVPVSLTPAGGSSPAGRVVTATPVGRGAGALSRLAQAGAWWPIPIGQGRFARGEPVDVRPMPGS